MMLTPSQIGHEHHAAGRARKDNPYRVNRDAARAWTAAWDLAEKAARLRPVGGR